MKNLYWLLIIFLVSGSFQCSTIAEKSVNIDGPWKAIHLLGYNSDADLDSLAAIVPALANKGINVVILEVDYHFEFESHPELRQGDEQMTKKGAGQFAKTCRKNGIRLIPQFQCVGHQSWAEHTYPLLTVYPELDLTPGAFPNNEGIYCREWDPYNPKVNEIVFALMDEIIDAFQADAMHVGMDEVFLITDDNAVSTRDKDPAEVFAKAVNDMYGHIVEKRGLEMLMWGDRFIDAAKIDYGEWEASANGTAPSIDMVPKDIIICDWHYNERGRYESVPMFAEHGFRVLPSSWKNVDASNAFLQYSQELNSGKVLGHLFTTWSKMTPEELLSYQPMVEGIKLIEALN